MNTIDFTKRLLKDEKIVWSGGPAPGLLLTGREWLLIPFSLLWCSFAIFLEIGATETQERLVLVPFVLAGLYIVAGRFLLDAWIRRRMHYAVTNKRVLISRSRPFSKFTAISLDQLPGTSLSESTDGRGTIRFGQMDPFWFGPRSDFFGYSWTPSLDPRPQFIAIENARSVFDQVQFAARKGA
jgi:hypothetical protein